MGSTRAHGRTSKRDTSSNIADSSQSTRMREKANATLPVSQAAVDFNRLGEKEAKTAVPLKLFHSLVKCTKSSVSLKVPLKTKPQRQSEKESQILILMTANKKKKKKDLK